MKVLVTGSSGFIGFHLCKYLLSKNYTVLGIDNHNKYYSTKIKNKRLSLLLEKSKFTFKKIDLTNKKKIDLLFKKFKPSIIFHLAGQPGVLYSFENPKSYYTNNVKATKNLCLIAKNYKISKFIFGSSSSVYGDQKKFPIKENFTLKPKNVYAKTKRLSEKLVFKTFSKIKVNFLIFRFFTVYGPFGRPDMFIHKLLNSLKKNLKIKLHNNGLNYRDFTFVDDVVEVLEKSININSNNKIINICRSKPIITIDLVNSILNKFNYKTPKIIKSPSVRGEMLKTHGSNVRLKKIFNKTKFTNINTGLKKTIISFKKFGY